MKVFLSIVSVLMLLLGSGWLFFPEIMLRSWSVQTDATGVYVGRRYGGLLFGYAAILWLCRAAGPSAARGAILGGGALVAVRAGSIRWAVAGRAAPTSMTAARAGSRVRFIGAWYTGNGGRFNSSPWP